MFPKDINILVVDDMVGMRKLIKSQLLELGYRNVSETENGKVAYSTVVEKHASGTPFGLILSDWNMPVMTGIEFLKKVRANPDVKKTPFLLITAEGEARQVLEAIRLGVSDYIVKPFTPAIFKAKFELVWKKHNSPPA